jgi:hypothetical protein
MRGPPKRRRAPWPAPSPKRIEPRNAANDNRPSKDGQGWRHLGELVADTLASLR